MPLLVYGVTYVFTCLIGAVCLLTSPSIVALQHLLAGGRAFWLSPEQIFTNVLLLVVSPLLVVAGYEIALRSLRGIPSASADPGADAPPDPALVAVWALTWMGGLASLARAGAFGRIDAWTNYRAWVFARWQLFDNLSMLEFVNIYMVVPAATALLVMRCSRNVMRPLRRVLLLLAIVAPMLLIDVLVFQKKTLIVSTVIVGLATSIRFGILDRATSRRFWLSLAGVALVGWVLYAFTILRPTIGKRAQAMTESVAPAPPVLAPAPDAGPPGPAPSKGGAAETGGPVAGLRTGAERPPASTSEGSRAAGVGATGKPFTEPRRSRILRSAVHRLFPGRWVGLPPDAWASAGTLARGSFLTFYVLLGPMLRTPLPALMYPALYPERSPFFGTDLGLDVFGIGRMPYDNVQVHQLLWPAIEGGTVMVPFQFGSYSQSGLGGALGESLAAGFCLAWIWVRVRSMSSPDEAAAAAALVLILAVYLAGDSIRNSLIASYGVFWGLAFLLGWARFGRRKGASR